jgi:hypothetical protein
MAYNYCVPCPLSCLPSEQWDILVHLYPSVTVGGYVVVDDFHIPECRAAILKYRQLRGIKEPMLPVPTDYAYG